MIFERFLGEHLEVFKVGKICQFAFYNQHLMFLGLSQTEFLAVLHAAVN